MAAAKTGMGFLVGLAASILVILILIYVVITQNSKITESTAKVGTLEEELVKRDDTERGLRTQIQNLNLAIGGSTSDVKPDIIRKQYIEGARAKLESVLNLESYLSEDFAKDLHKPVKLEKTKTYTDLLSIYDDLFIQITALVGEINRLVLRRDETLVSLTSSRADKEKAVGELTAQIEDEKTRFGQLQQQKLDVEKEADAKQRELIDAKNAVLAEKEAEHEKSTVEQARLESKINELEGVIQNLRKKELRTLAETTADGEVTHADQRLGLAWINLGQKHNLRRGMTFEVFQYVKGGEKKKKGMVEIRTLEEDLAQCAILAQVDEADPIVKGDWVVSPLYDKEKAPVFVFAGTKVTNDRYNQEELIRRIEETGSRVDREISVETDFVIAIDEAEQDEKFAKAVQFGVIVMREPELLEFLGR